MSIQQVQAILNNVLYETHQPRGLLEFTWSKEDSDNAQAAFIEARKKLKSIGIPNIDIQPMSQRVMVVLNKTQEPIVTEIMTELGFQLINTIFDPGKQDGVPSWYNPTLPHNR
jgi:hypothetical protein